MSNNFSLHRTTDDLAGFRLMTFEVVNWGAFSYAKLDLQGQNALLTGTNGSGKTTLVDALVTLFVPRAQGFYNQSAGEENSKLGRTTEDYVLGNYGKEEVNGTPTKMALRKREDSNAYCILLANFYNDTTMQTVSIGHLYYFRNGNFNTQFFVAKNEPMSIASHFENQFTGDIAALKRLYKEKVVFYDSFNQYALAFMRMMHIKNGNDASNHKALILFAKTVGIKVLGELDSFVRDNVLYKSDWKSNFETIKENLKDLENTHNSIKKARQQQELLEPIIQNYTKWVDNNDELQTLTDTQNLVEPFFAIQKIQLIRERIIEKETEKAELEQENAKLLDDLTANRDAENDLKNQVQNSDIGRRTEQLKLQIEALSKSILKRSQKMTAYNAYTDILQVKKNPDAGLFFAQIAKIEAQKTGLEAQKTVLDEDIIAQTQVLNAQKQTLQQLRDEIDSLKKRDSNIDSRFVEMRDDIAKALNIAAEKIPFVGELVQIKEAEKAQWEPAIEKLLRGFAQSILVSEEDYRAFNKYVNTAKLKHKIVYFKASANEKLVKTSIVGSQYVAVYQKLEVKQNSPYAVYLENELKNRFDHECLPDATNFEKVKRALTPQGLIKDNSRHQKDGYKEANRNDYVLGWSNKEKIRLLEREGFTLKEVVFGKKGLDETLKIVKTALDNLRKFEIKCSEFLMFNDFNELDFRSQEGERDVLTKQFNELTKNDNIYKALKKQLDDIQAKIKKQDQQKTANDKYLGKLDTNIENMEDIYANTKKLLPPELENNDRDTVALDAWARLKNKMLNRFVGSHDWTTVEQIERSLKNTTAAIADLLLKKTSANERIKNEIQQKMREFVNPSQAIFAEFPNWVDDIYEFSENPKIEHFDQYATKYTAIVKDDLPSKERTFKQMMEKDIQEAMRKFKSSFDDARKEIDENLESINAALQIVPFNNHENTHLIIAQKPSKDEHIRSFRAALEDCIYDGKAYKQANEILQSQLRSTSFLRIQELLLNIETKPEWLRRNVTDVRFWQTFYAKEVTETGEIRKVIDTTLNDSGGEKAKLTYTILAAALVYQFNIGESKRNPHSFRFIVVDEAFAKLDGDNSIYLLELCKQLNIQLLCITPSKDWETVEPYIATAFLVNKKADKPPLSFVHYIAKEELAELLVQ